MVKVGVREDDPGVMTLLLAFAAWLVLVLAEIWRLSFCPECSYDEQYCCVELKGSQQFHRSKIARYEVPREGLVVLLGDRDEACEGFLRRLTACLDARWACLDLVVVVEGLAGSLTLGITRVLGQKYGFAVYLAAEVSGELGEMVYALRRPGEPRYGRVAGFDFWRYCDTRGLTRKELLELPSKIFAKKI